MPRGKSKRCRDCKWFEHVRANWGYCFAPQEEIPSIGIVYLNEFGEDDCDCFQPRKDRKEK